MKVHFVTFGCKANQYDTEKFRQELEARGALVVDDVRQADTVVINTCTVTNQADVEARKAIRRARRDNPAVQIVVAGCSAALYPSDYAAMEAVVGVVRGHDPLELAALIAPQSPLLEHDEEPIGAVLLARDERGTRGWMKIQDGCDRHCSFCATRLARGASRSRLPADLVAEAIGLAQHHAEIVLTGIHIGHYGVDLNHGKQKDFSLSRLVETLIAQVPNVRFRLGSVEATEIDDHLIEILADTGRLVPHLHVPMQAGSDNVLRAMRRWHTREQYRRRVLEISERLPYLGLGADVIVGFPGESDDDHAQTRALVDELPYTYLHVFPYSVRDNTVAAALPNHIPRQIATTRSSELRELALEKGLRYRRARAGQGAEIVVEAGGFGLTEDYLRVRLLGDPNSRLGQRLFTALAIENDELVAYV
ncbi:MAG: MiaB/RimO family radical SAM methylthiotransferase [Bradymonadaceae bacterium]|nr:MiaB/RimO family radical SAM methylthiotransferase [Lujinxingiaceae bacterium]